MGINEQRTVSKKYTFNECPIILARKLNSAQVRHALLETGCYLDVQSRVLNWRHRATPWTKGSVVEVVGPSGQSVDKCNTLMDSALPFYRDRKPYLELTGWKSESVVRKQPYECTNLRQSKTNSEIKQELRVKDSVETGPLKTGNHTSVDKPPKLQGERSQSCKKRKYTSTNGTSDCVKTTMYRAASVPAVERRERITCSSLCNNKRMTILEPAGDFLSKDSNEHNVADRNCASGAICVLKGSKFNPDQYTTDKPNTASQKFERTSHPNFGSIGLITKGNRTRTSTTSRVTNKVETQGGNIIQNGDHKPNGDEQPRIAVMLKTSNRSGYGTGRFTVEPYRPSGNKNHGRSSWAKTDTILTPKTQTPRVAAVDPNGCELVQRMRNRVSSGPQKYSTGSHLSMRDNQTRVGISGGTNRKHLDANLADVIDNTDPKLFYACVNGQSVMSDETVSTLPTTIAAPGRYKLAPDQPTDPKSDRPECSYGTFSAEENQATMSRYIPKFDQNDRHSHTHLRSSRRIADSEVSVVRSSSLNMSTELPGSDKITVKSSSDADVENVAKTFRRSISMHSGPARSDAILHTTQVQPLIFSSCGDVRHSPVVLYHPFSSSIIPLHPMASQMLNRTSVGVGYRVGLQSEDAQSIRTTQLHKNTQALVEQRLETPVRKKQIDMKTAALTRSNRNHEQQSVKLTERRNARAASTGRLDRLSRPESKVTAKPFTPESAWKPTGKSITRTSVTRVTGTQVKNKPQQPSNEATSRSKCQTTPIRLKVPSSDQAHRATIRRTTNQGPSASRTPVGGTLKTNSFAIGNANVPTAKTTLGRAKVSAKVAVPNMHTEKGKDTTDANLEERNEEVLQVQQQQQEVDLLSSRQKSLSVEPVVIEPYTQLVVSNRTSSTTESSTQYTRISQGVKEEVFDPKFVQVVKIAPNTSLEKEENQPGIACQFSSKWQSQFMEKHHAPLTPARLPRPSSSSATLNKARGSKEVLERSSSETSDGGRILQSQVKKITSPPLPEQPRTSYPPVTPVFSKVSPINHLSSSTQGHESSDDSLSSVRTSHDIVTSPISGSSEDPSMMETTVVLLNGKPMTNLFSSSRKEFESAGEQGNSKSSTHVTRTIVTYKSKTQAPQSSIVSNTGERSNSDLEVYKRFYKRRPCKVMRFIQRCIPWLSRSTQ